MTKTTAVTLYATALAALCGSFGTRAQAQDDLPAPKPIAIKLGVFLPSNSDLKEVIGKTWFSAGADYAFLQKTGDGQSPAALVPLGYVDYAINKSHGITADYIGVGPGARYYLGAPGTSSLTPYVGAGAGAEVLHSSGNGTSLNQTRFGFKVNAGVEFSQTYLFEINYTYPGSLSGTHYDGFNIQVGAKF